MANQTYTPPIPEMVERVAQVLKHCEYDCSTWPIEALRHLAKIVLSTIREPTFCMITAARRVQLEPPTDDDKGHFGQAWRNMIDAALGE